MWKNGRRISSWRGVCARDAYRGVPRALRLFAVSSLPSLPLWLVPCLRAERRHLRYSLHRWHSAPLRILRGTGRGGGPPKPLALCGPAIEHSWLHASSYVGFCSLVLLASLLPPLPFHFLDAIDWTVFQVSNSVHFSNRIITFGKPHLFIKVTNTKCRRFSFRPTDWFCMSKYCSHWHGDSVSQ